MKIMHLADLHLDSPFSGLNKDMQPLQESLIQAPYRAFERAVSIALNQQIDLMIIAGDIYNADRQTIYAQTFFIQQLLRLNKANIPVVIGHGNHDYLRGDKYQINYPENVFEFMSDKVDYFDFHLSNNETVRVYGFTYTTRWIRERKINEYPINPQQTHYTIGLLHGSAEGIESDQGNYAPFSVNELISKKYDYWALGHIHKAEVLNEAPLIQYSGTIQGRHRNETGDKGAYIVEINKGIPTTNEFISLASIIWQEAVLTCQPEWQANDIIEALNSVLDNYQTESKASGQSYILSVELEQAHLLDYDLQQQIEANELMDALDPIAMEDYFVSIAKIKLKHEVSADIFEYDEKLNQSFKEALNYVEDDNHYHDILDDVFKHKVIKKWLPTLVEDNELKRDIVKTAQDLIIQQFGLTNEEVNYED